MRRARRVGGVLHHRIQERLRSYLAPPEVVRRPGDLLDFPDRHSYVPPQLPAFGDEPGVERHPWVQVGRYSSLNGGTRVILGGGHHPEWVSTYPFRVVHGLAGALEDGQPSSRGPVHIGSDVWIGYDVVIQSGTTIGDGAVVATGTLVHRDVPPYAIVGGNPSRLIRYRFTEEQVAALLRIRWWDWPDDVVLSRVDELCDPDIDGFIRRHDPGL